MEQILSEICVSITQLKKNPSAVIEQSQGLPVAVLNHNRPAAYLVPARAYEAMMEILDDQNLRKIILKREKEKRIKVNIDEL